MELVPIVSQFISHVNSSVISLHMDLVVILLLFFHISSSSQICLQGLTLLALGRGGPNGLTG